MMTLRLELEVKRADGTTRYKEQQAVNSWVFNAANLWSDMMNHADGSGYTNTGSQANKNHDMSASTSKPLEFGTVDTQVGIFLGTGSTAADKDDFKLETEIGNGSGAGQLTYQNMVAYQGALGTATGFTTLFERTLQNDSGGTITVNEVGVHCEFDTNTGAGVSLEEFLVIRDVLSTGVVVLDAESVIVRYFTDWDV